MLFRYCSIAHSYRRTDSIRKGTWRESAFDLTVFFLRVSAQASFLTNVSMMASAAHIDPWLPAARKRASKT